MKKLLIAALTAFTATAFAQSYIIMDNGITLTTDKAGFAYDFGHYAFPQKVKLKGGQYFVEDGGILATIDENGFLYRKYEVIPEVIKGKGINYFLGSEGELYTIDHTGGVTLTVDETFKSAVNFGGNYFTVMEDEENKILSIHTIDSTGKHTKMEADKFKSSEIVAYGGTYFMTNRGVVHTISKDGLIIPQADMRVGIMMKRGGNYFTDSTGVLFTVAEDGSLKLPALPMSLNVSTMTKLGSNYFIDLSGKLFVVDRDGNIYERQFREHDMQNATIISL